MKISTIIASTIYSAGLIVLVGACQPVPNGQNKVVAEIQFSEIPSDSVLLYALSPDLPQLKEVYKLRDSGNWDQALKSLAKYLKESAKERYYFSWEKFPQKYENYFKMFPKRLEYHRQNSAYFKTRYSANTQWELPFKNLRGEDVTAYRLRHIARQSKHPDMVMMYFAKSPEAENLSYWTEQMLDLNRAFTAGEYDQGGNAVYEVFRAGKRTHYWLFGHHAYLSTPDYGWEEQIESLRTFLHTAAQLAENGKKVRHGNHHTRGMVALFEIAASYPEYARSEAWVDLSTTGLSWHLEHEINPDGFQFERTIHYHMSDIENFFRVWQLAKRGNIELPEVFSSQFKKMFDALIVLAQPDKKLPVLQDDTDALHAETNEISGAMAIGTILWQDPAYSYFNTGTVSPLFYWLLNEKDLNRLDKTSEQHPALSSAALESTGYYVMRNGWQQDSEYMVISAGLSDTKPDHQHADMLGVVAYADGNEILPNYQVKYNEPDFPFWKDSWVKNVALVDSLTQTQKWKGNSGGSGFGKWLDLPNPKVILWETNAEYDRFIGSHDGFEKHGIEYQREILFVKKGFWIVKDRFSNPSCQKHEYQQVWQGIYKEVDKNNIVRKFDNGSSLIISDLDAQPTSEWRHGSYRDKGNALRVLHSANTEVVMTTLLLPQSDPNSLSLAEVKVIIAELEISNSGWKE